MSDERMEDLRRILDEGEPVGFEPYFATRVMRRVAVGSGGWDALHRSLRSAFVRVAVAGVTVAALVAGYSLAAGPSLDLFGSTLESLLGLPSPTLETALQVGDV